MARAETLSDVSFTLKSGSFYFLTGPSGAGKTSLLKLLYLAQRPRAARSSGCSARMPAPCPAPASPASAAASAWCSRISGWSRTFPPMTISRCRCASPACQESDIEAPVREMLAWVGLTDRGRAKPPTLSGGEQQRIAIARAVIARPELLVADEPTGNVDPDMAERLLYLFESSTGSAPPWWSRRTTSTCSTASPTRR
jgi:cell division transport system ATP-binding protein